MTIVRLGLLMDLFKWEKGLPLTLSGFGDYIPHTELFCSILIPEEVLSLTST